MHVLLDNTGIHAVARCLAGRGVGEVDALGFLQFATSLVFCDRLSVGNFERDDVRQRTDETMRRLYALGVSDADVEQRDIDEETFIRVSASAARTFAEDLDQLIPEDAGDLVATTPDLGPTTQIDGGVHGLVTDERSPRELEQIATEALAKRAVGAVEYAFASSPVLRDAARRLFVARDGWAPSVSAHLATVFRVYLNVSVARETNAHYTPAVARAQLLHTAESHAIARLSGIVADAAAQMSCRPLLAPSVGRALLRQSGGHPDAVIERACEARETARPLRDALRPHISGVLDGDETALAAMDRHLVELAQVMRRELGIEKAPSLGDALDVQLVVGIPSPRLSFKSAIAWIQHYRMRKQAVVLTEMSRALAYRVDLDRDYGLFVRRATGQL